MPHFAVLRMERIPTTLTHEGAEIPAFNVKAVPLATINGGPLTIDADAPESALGVAVRRYPHFRGILAVQELQEYATQHPYDSGRILRSAKARSSDA